MAVPIWKDRYFDLGQADWLYYRIVLVDTGDIIYSGKAYRKPGDHEIGVKVNDICADYLQNVLPNLSQAEFSELTLPPTFRVEAANDYRDWTSMGSVQFLNDWSYDYDFNAATMGLSFPINGRIDSRMPIVWTGLDVSQVTITIYYTNGSTSTVIIPVEITDDFDSSFNDDFAHSVRAAGSGTAVFYPTDWDDVDRIVIGNSTFHVVTSCAKYALYYLNAYGGWDCLLIEGNHMGVDTIKRYTREMVYLNTSIDNRGKQNYVNEITRGFTLHSGWLLDDQGERMHHLINSTNVYLYDIANEKMIPVTIPSTTCEYKTFKNQGNKFVDYAIQVEIAQDRIRR